MVFNDSHQRLSFVTSGTPHRQVVDVDGIQMLAFQHAAEGHQDSTAILPSWQTIAGKKANIEGIEKPLWQHMYETAVLLKTILTESAYRGVVELIREQTDVKDSNELINCLCFFTAIHDIGKIHPQFQEKLKGESNGFRHEGYSKYILRYFLKEHGIRSRHSNQASMYRLCDVVGDHHQNHAEGLPSVYSQQYPHDKELIEDFVRFANKQFPFKPFAIVKNENLFCQIFSGLLRFCDRGASSFADEVRYSGDMGSYEKAVHDRCVQFIKTGGIEHRVFQEHYSYNELFEGFTEEKLYPTQKAMEDVVAGRQVPECTLVEDQPGSGKTQAAIYAAMNMMKKADKQGLYFALPTGATAEAMLPRLEELQKRGFFTDVDVRLMTGTAWMKDTDEDAQDKADWSKSGPRKLFSSFACGTVDQIMTAAEAIKAGDMRLLALSNKIVVIDEFHDYEAWQRDIILNMLRWLKAMHVPVIILSATLRASTRKEICSIYADDVSSCSVSGYPRITYAVEGKINNMFPEVRVHKTKQIKVIKEQESPNEILRSVWSGGNTLCIFNTVDRANAAYNYLNSIKPNDVSLLLYTARTEPANKQHIGRQIVTLYGKNGKRPHSSIVISTQICEMSMDVDFDTVFSEVAPMDALFQRMGRMQRHDDKDTVREHGFKSVFWIMLPEQSHTWYLPYNQDVMNAMLKHVCNCMIKIPDDLQNMLEAAYADAGTSWEQKERERVASVRSTGIEIGSPADSYKVNKNLYGVAVTRDPQYETVKLICLPDGEHIQNDRDWCIETIKNHSVTISKYMFTKMKYTVVQNDMLPIWIRDYTIIHDKAEYHGPDHIFTGGIATKDFL